VRPAIEAVFAAEDQIIAGNVIAYGATSGQVFIRGQVGERFAVRNSGASLVVEGIGDHGCEYMTGGQVLVLGPTGRNFAAGMSGGVAYVLDVDGAFASRCNFELVGFDAMDADDERTLDDAAAETVHGLIVQHLEETESPVADKLLADWPTSADRFTRAMPRDYRIVLGARAEAERAGLSEAETTAKMMEAAHG
jgi:glutamate synthase (NADPH/NADH) large chain